ncbi:hypothetical protein [Cohnella faecalis]|uniref:Uncharacterized protein n=1 Tax=Cohnella faecalis TaxID=2315694 RepID=A0A398CTA7_9BACL|nr:hypothetical protein [Cohnella faecalis]RIE05390.1 hypothetical protein D3H35_00980 [Cohnella faecalis]
MLDNAKRKAALLLHRFLQYWTTRAVKEQPRIDPTVYVMPNAYVSAEVAVGRYSYIRGGAQLESGSVGAFCSIAPDVLIAETSTRWTRCPLIRSGIRRAA